MDSRALSYAALTLAFSHPLRRRGSAASRMGEGLEMDSGALSYDFLAPEGNPFTLLNTERSWACAGPTETL